MSPSPPTDNETCFAWRRKDVEQELKNTSGNELDERTIGLDDSCTSQGGDVNAPMVKVECEIPLHLEAPPSPPLPQFKTSICVSRYQKQKVKDEVGPVDPIVGHNKIKQEDDDKQEDGDTSRTQSSGGGDGTHVEIAEKGEPACDNAENVEKDKNSDPPSPDRPPGVWLAAKPEASVSTATKAGDHAKQSSGSEDRIGYRARTCKDGVERWFLEYPGPPISKRQWEREVLRKNRSRRGKQAP